MSIKLDEEILEIINEDNAWKPGLYTAPYEIVLDAAGLSDEEIAAVEAAGAVHKIDNAGNDDIIIPAGKVFEIKTPEGHFTEYIITFGGVDFDAYIEDTEEFTPVDSTVDSAADIVTVGDETAKFAKQGYNALEGVIKNLEAFGERNTETSDIIDILIIAQEALRNMVPELQ